MDTAKVQHVNKASSDELLRKFAELGSDESSTKKQSRGSKRRKRCQENPDGDHFDNPSSNSTSLVERKSLLPLTATRRSVILRQLGIGRPQFRVREIKNKSLMDAIEKTWRKTVERASKVFIERHYNRHKRLINDIV